MTHKILLQIIVVLLLIYEINHILTAKMKWKNEEMIVEVNAIYAIA